MLKIITKEQAIYAIQHKEFEKCIIHSKDKVAVLMTQDWCPQWSRMQGWLANLNESSGIDAYLLIYNGQDFFEDFLNFKENHWNNSFIPYIRYYYKGNLKTQTNAVSKEVFLSLWE
jgi:hypothetical protein